MTRRTAPRINPGAMDGNRRLLHAILTRALLDVSGYGKPQDRRDAKAWLFDDGEEGAHSFTAVCSYLNLDPSAVRRLIVGERGRSMNPSPAPHRYRYGATCTRCNALVLHFTAPLDDETVTRLLEHLWRKHPDVVAKPQTVPLGELLRLIKLRHVG